MSCLHPSVLTVPLRPAYTWYLTRFTCLPVLIPGTFPVSHTWYSLDFASAYSASPRIRTLLRILPQAAVLSPAHHFLLHCSPRSYLRNCSPSYPLGSITILAPSRIGVDLLATISASLDPRLQAVRDEDRSARAIQSTQVMSLTTQLRDAHATVNKLHGQLAQVERERANAERRADRLEMQLEMAKFMQDSRSGHQQQERVRRETIYRDGGRSTIWVTPDEAGDDFGLDDHDVVSRRDIVEDQRVGRYTRAIVPRVPMTPRTSATPRASATPASGPSSARLDVSFTPTSITISPSHGRESKGPNEID
ncbi:hypothetical protein DEU56DRAFT_920490 [Suillus clintonianus]|uniref:uncharacterized protein n=1 Tax=Suillus clintonianus TaxID=1904413 RepID=UPI001B8679D5|nr:uncharacterized protein DEU56DRAFT_920490 [Suillus clintonianus]KAG2108352.1 hypothetical protein DEU56DRAFT_920490 [Suillus clintonianus]